ncbi:MAG: hypothetical protein NTY66_00210 [Candidatus Vogelbacteria bacterium]|nr:hypothetical protein [Candidatus Vogelbacteria bacterium]
MGLLSRQPNANESEVRPKGLWAPSDPTGALLMKTAVHCCGCGQVTAARHVVIVERTHIFCPSCAEKGVCNCLDHFNVSEFIEHQDPDRPRYGASGEAGEAD